MKSLIQFFAHVLFGVDMIVAMLAYALVLSVFPGDWNWWMLIGSVLFAHLPDLDMVPYFILKRFFGVQFRLSSHRVIGHYPIIVIPLVVVCVIGLADNNEMAWLTLAMIGIVGHFIHDSTEPQGLHWFSPISWDRITLMRGWPDKVSRYRWIRIHFSKGAAFNKSALDEFAQRVDPLMRGQILVWGLSAVLLLALYLI